MLACKEFIGDSLESASFCPASNARDTACSDEHVKTASSLCSAVPCPHPLSKEKNNQALQLQGVVARRLKIKNFIFNRVDHHSFPAIGK